MKIDQAQIQRALDPQERPATPDWLTAGAILVGCLCRVAQYAAHRSYWIDEASLFLNVRSKTWRQLLGPLDFAQMAPPGFLLMERGLYCALGGSEWVMRLPLLLGGILGLLLFARLAWRALPAPWATVALLLYAMADRLIYHDNELKPYGLDVLVCVGMLLVTWPGAGRGPLRRMAMLCAVAAIGVWFSFPSILVFAALAAAIAATLLRDRGSLLRAGLLCLAPIASFGLVYFISRHAQGNDVLLEYHQGAFVDLHRPWLLPLWLGRSLLALCDYPIPAAGPVVLLMAIAGMAALAARSETLAGFARLFRTGPSLSKLRVFPSQYSSFLRLGPVRNPQRDAAREFHHGLLWQQRACQELAMLVGPIGMALAAAILHKYPFDGARLTVFLSPCLLLLVCIGTQSIFESFRRQWRHLVLLPMAYLLAVAVYWAAYHLASPRIYVFTRPIAQYVHEHAQAGDAIYLAEDDLRRFECYWPMDNHQLRGHLDDSDAIPRRFWFVWTKGATQKMVREKNLPWARQFAREIDRYDLGDRGGAALLEKRPDAPPHIAPPPYRGDETMHHGTVVAVDAT